MNNLYKNIEMFFTSTIKIIDNFTYKFIFLLVFFLISYQLSANPPKKKIEKQSRGDYGDDLVNGKYAKYLTIDHQMKDIIRHMEPDLDDAYFIDVFEKHGVKVVTNLNTILTTFCGNTNGMWSVKREEYPDIKNEVLEALDRYPPGFARRFMKKIVVTSKLTIKNAEVGGYVKGPYASQIFISTKSGRKKSLTGVIHHEFNHLLSTHNKYYKQDTNWEKFNPTDFSYGTGGCTAIIEGRADTRHLEKYVKVGFASEYGTASMEEDIATITEWAISHMNDFQNYALKYDPMKYKFSLIMQFYSGFDSRIDDRFWLQQEGLKLDEDIQRPVSKKFFLDDAVIAGPYFLQYRVQTLLQSNPTWDYDSEISNNTRPERKTNKLPKIINDSDKFYKVKLLPPEKDQQTNAILVAPGQQYSFQLYEHPPISNRWALELHEVELQPLNGMIKDSKLIDLPKGIFVIQNVMDIKKRPKKYNAPMREIYLSTLFEKKIADNFSNDEVSENDYSQSKKNPFGYIVVNDTQFILTIKTYTRNPKNKDKMVRKIRMVPNQTDATGLSYLVDGIEIIEQE
jgi:hypothetical protein